MEAPVRKPLSSHLIDWYWAHGFAREGRYALPKGDWVDRLYRIHNDASMLAKALDEERPSMAIWGPSQTGKSTLVSRYLDAKAEPTTGVGSALHWDQGKPCLFLAPNDPEDLAKMPEDTTVLNPFNSGLDASACLTRFTLPEGQPRFPQQPVEIRLVDEYELWQSLARGYDSQCLGPLPPGAKAVAADDESAPPRFPTSWSPERFTKLLDRYRKQAVPRDAKPSREAYERLQGLTRIIDDLIFAELPRFRGLASGDVPWPSLRREILSDGEGDSGGTKNALLYDADSAEKFAAELLWDGYAVMTDMFRQMRERLRSLREKWDDKPIYCALDVAALFLDMESYTVLLKPLGPGSRPKDKRIHDRAPNFGYREQDGAIILGVGSEFANRLVNKPEDFGIFQGLVWEMVVPLNPKNLDDTPFRTFLRDADLLDFPGVERGGQGASTGKIDLDVLADRRQSGRVEDDENDAHQFYIRILKRGKTSCIVTTYARKLTIDGFCIFQDLDRDKPNAGELVTGIQTWWRVVAPEFYRNPQGESPLPLNFVLLWWATLFNEGHRMGNLVKKLSGLGPIADPEHSTVFALNYYRLSRGTVLPEKLATIDEAVQELKADSAFGRLFSRTTSSSSFDQMVADRESGGTDFFFTQLKGQVQNLQQNRGGRQALLEPRQERIANHLSELLQEHELIPDPKPKDDRKEHLERFHKALLEALPGMSERKLRRLNHDLREILNIHYTALTPTPRDPTDISAQFLRNEMALWINDQVRRWDERPEGSPDIPGLADRSELQQVLQALAKSIEPDFDDLADWLGSLASYAATRGLAESDLRRPLALKLGNALVYGGVGVRTRRADDEPMAGFDQPRTRGDYTTSPSYRFFLASFVGPKGQLEYLINRNVTPSKRPDQPGDDEVRQLLEASGHALALSPSA